MKIKVYHSVDVYGNGREYWFTPNYNLPLENVVDSKKDIEVSDEEFQRLLKASMEEVSKFVRDVLRS